MEKPTPIDLTNQELFEKVFTLKGFYLECYHDCVYICGTTRSSTICCFSKKGNNELGLFLDCLYCMGIRNPILKQISSYAYVFSLAIQHALNGFLSKGDDIPNVVKGFKFDGNDTTFEQQCFFFEYIQDVLCEQPVIVQQDSGKLALDKKISFIEPLGDEMCFN